MNTEDVLETHKELISAYEAVYGSSVKRGRCCVLDLAAALREEREQRAEIERKAIEQSEYIQAHGLTEYEVARLKAQVETTTWYNGTLLTELSTLRERVAELETEWQQEHTERICLEERVKYLGTRLESEIEVALEAARKEKR